MKLNISSEFKEYFQLMIDYSEKELEANNTFIKMNQMMTERLQADIAGTTTEESVMRLRIDGEKVGDQWQKLGEEADEIKKKADDLYIKLPD